MELSDLRIFQAIAEESSISGAAKRLDYVQSNVTTRLRKLEEELGVLLFYRSVKGMTLTEKAMQSEVEFSYRGVLQDEEVTIYR